MQRLYPLIGANGSLWQNRKLKRGVGLAACRRRN